MKTKQVVLTTLIAALMLLSLMPIAFAAAPEGGIPSPSSSTPVTVLPGLATIDGNPSEWDLAATYAADMCAGWDCTSNPAEAKLYLAYDCNAQILYVLVLTQPGYTIPTNSDTWVKQYDPGQSPSVFKLTPISFALVQPGSDIVGWEASYALAPGSVILVHNNVNGGATAGLGSWITVNPSCPPPTAVGLVSFDAQGAARSIVLSWETASEIDNLGFNLYRAESADGPWTRLNANLIPSQVAPGSPVGAAYTYEDSVPQRGIPYFYRLESVDVYGHATSYGPVNATLQLFRRTLIRPRLDAGLTQK
jgi:hypothetical protein